jgi:hypothetical protein
MTMEGSQLLNNRAYWVSCRMLARSARKVALPTPSSPAESSRTAVACTTGSRAGKHALPVGLLEWNEAHAGGDRVDGQFVKVGVQHPRRRNPMSCTGDTDRDHVPCALRGAAGA